jgi:hypothetical protein
LMEFVVIVALIAIGLGNYFRFRDPLYPPLLHASLWAFILMLHAMLRPSIIDLSGQVLFIV